MARTEHTDLAIDRLYPTTPMVLPFAPTSVVRAFLLQRPEGNVLIYSTGKLEEDVAALRERGGVERQYLGHWHEAMFGPTPSSLGAQRVHHEAESAPLQEHGGPGETFAERHRLGDDLEVIPIPGHTPGSTAYLWDTGEHRLLFTGDSLYVHKGKWRVTVLKSSDREQYLQSLERIRELHFDVLVPWVVDASDPYMVQVGPDERRERIDTLISWVRQGTRDDASSGGGGSSYR